MERVEPIQPIKRVLSIRKALPNYLDLDLELQHQSSLKRQLRAKKSIKNSSKPESGQQQRTSEDGIGNRADYKA